MKNPVLAKTGFYFKLQPVYLAAAGAAGAWFLVVLFFFDLRLRLLPKLPLAILPFLDFTSPLPIVFNLSVNKKLTVLIKYSYKDSCPFLFSKLLAPK